MTFLFKLTFIALVVLVLVGLTLHYFQAANDESLEAPPLTTYLRAWVGEPFAIALTLILVPVSWLSRVLQQTSVGSGAGTPVVVISTSLWGSPAPCMFLQWVLWRNGLTNVHAIALPHSRGSLDKVAAHLVTLLKQLMPPTDQRPLHIVAHGSAGLVLRYALDHPELPKLGRVVTLGCPHQGSMSAIFFSPQTSLLLRPQSAFLNALPKVPSDWFSIYSDVDPLIIPAQSANWGTGSERVEGLGHFQLPLSSKVCQMVAEHLISRERPPSSAETLEDSSRFA